MKKKHLLFFCHSAFGHVNPIRENVIKLRHYHSVTVVCNNSTSLMFSGLDQVEVLTYPSQPFSEAASHLPDKSKLTYTDLVKYYVSLAERCIDDLIAFCDNRKFDVLVVDDHAVFARPLLSLYAPKAVSFHASLFRRSDDYRWELDQGLLPTAFQSHTLDKSVQQECNRRLERHPILRDHFPPLDRLMVDTHASRCLTTFPPSFGHMPNSFHGYHPLSGCLAFEERDIIYVSFGTEFSEQLTVDDVTLIVDGLRQYGLSIVVSCGGSEALFEALSPISSALVKVERWVDQGELLKQARVFVTHSGMNSVLDAMAVETPMLCLPQGDDQWLIANKVEELGFGQTFYQVADLLDALRPESQEAWFKFNQQIRIHNRQFSHHRWPLHDWITQSERLPQPARIHAAHFFDHFEYWLQQAPLRQALCDQHNVLTYGQLSEQSTKIAQGILMHHYQQTNQQMPEGTHIALLMERNVNLYVAMLAIWKAGGCYVPLSARFPEQRIAHIINDASCALVITDSLNVTRCQELGVLFDDLLRNTVVSDTTFPMCSLEQQAYLIYTSGSTGTPKGVCISHRNLSSLIDAHIQRFFTDEHRRSLLFSDCVFDASVFELFPGLACGHTLFVCTDEDKRVPERLQTLIREQNVDMATLPPSILEWLDPKSLQSINTLIVAGESPSVRLFESLSSVKRIFNAYGPTECTVCVTAHLYQSGDEALNIGYPLSNSRILLMDESGASASSEGDTGELWVSGDGVSQGYWQLPEVNENAFVRRWSPSGEDRWYKTGDKVMRLTSGELLFSGRGDDQVKIAGHRIELDEIRQVVLDVQGVVQAIVTNKTGLGRAHLAVYIASKRNQELEERVRAHCEAHLPGYMQPHSITIIDALPITINGKVDFKALPKPRHNGSVGFDEQIATLMGLTLRRRNFGLEEDFFASGGSSIDAVRVSAAARACLTQDVPAEAIFEHRTANKIAASLTTTPESQSLERSNSVASISDNQLGMLVSQRMHPESKQFHLAMLMQVTQPMELEILKSLIRQVLGQYPIFSAQFYQDDTSTWRRRTEMQPIDISSFNVTGTEALAERLTELYSRPFDLTEACLRVTTIMCNEKQYVFFCIHHVIFDAYSCLTLLRHFNSHIRNGGQRLISGATSEGSVSVPNPQEYEELAAYWRHYLNDYHPTRLPLPLTCSVNLPSTASCVTETMSGERFHTLQRCSQLFGCSVITLLLAGFYLLLRDKLNTSDLTIGLPFDNRDSTTFDQMGLFVNALPVRVSINNGETLKEVISKVSESVMLVKKRQNTPLSFIANTLNTRPVFGTHPVYQILFASFDLASVHSEKDPMRLLDETPWIQQRDSQLDLVWQVRLESDKVTVHALFADGFLESGEAGQWLDKYIDILEEVIEAREEQVVPLMSSEEVAPNHSLLTQIKTNAQHKPQKLALRCEGQVMTYGELDHASEVLANRLLTAKVTHSLPVCISLPRSVSAIVAMMAVLKAGKPYVFLEPSWPQERKRQILVDTKAQQVITSADIAPLPFAEEVRDVINFDGNALRDSARPKPLVPSVRSSLAYLVYTSGTTGRPKGVCISHHTACNMVQAHLSELGLRAYERALAFSPFSFDGSVYEIFTALSAGQTLFIASDEERQDPRSIEQLIVEHRIETLALTPSYLSLLTPDALTDTKVLLVAGEAATTELMETYSRVTKVINVYGPSEATVAATYHVFSHGDDPQTIGRPFAHIEVRVLNTEHQDCAAMEVGELYIGGDCLAQEYLDKDALTQRQFVWLTFDGEAARYYKTEDRVYCDDKNNLVFVGRADRQCKIRGNRVELGEVESALCAIEGVHHAYVFLGDSSALCACVSAQAVEVETLLSKLRLQLPSYAIPGQCQVVASMPLTANGKVDIQQVEALFSSKSAQAEGTDSLDVISSIWKSELGTDVGSSTNFFDAGGTSISIVALRDKLERAFGLEISVSELFAHPTVKLQQQLISQKEGIERVQTPSQPRRRARRRPASQE
ncbi:non-ribosomal peptide synthetase [Grimontia sp. NTOU-MAR1]|uniref:non-ribosomal peptide synthetase n=1 Tax=Grimontia sp. NTOU-MAR1 TaxID=3111011 RepID=UPI002DBBAA37|nr:non-ribosomal peptide synthetase [Grimontia sp. NTOU-MAR1]WRV98374.1 amino acid adenylation domain-containing protein [Grimontia sp. NTOU-MAR1]